MSALFVYGTLMCEDIFKKVTGITPIARKGILKNFRRFLVKDEHYPGVVGQKGFQVEGLVYENISEQSWVLLDRFEGDMYFRQEVKIHLENGKMMDAFVYVVKPKYTHMIGTCDWSFDRFITSGKAQFVRGYSGFQDLAHTTK